MQPSLGAAPTGVGAQPGDQPYAAAGPVAAAPVFTSPAATTATSFAPVAGQQAGSVAASGGLVPDGTLRTAAFGAGVAADGMGRQAQFDAAAATVAGQQVVDPASLQGQGAASAAMSQQKGPAAWDESWAKKFKDAGAPAEIIQQLTFTGAMGADQAQLQQMLDQITGEIDTQLAKFAHEHPEEFKKLRSNPAVDRAMLAQIAAGVNAGQVPKEQLEQLVDSIGKSQGKMIFDTFIKPMIVWSLIPGWGAIRLGFAPFTGGKDILTGEKMFGDGMSTAFTVMAGLGGAFTIWNHARGAMQVAAGHRLAAAGGDAAMVAANEGYKTLTLGQKVASYLPGTHANQVFGGLGRMDQTLTQGISHLKGIERELAENVIQKWRNGEISILADPASKWTKMGFQPNTRGYFIGRNKPMFSITSGATPTIHLDGRMTGKSLAAHLASAGVEFADDTVGNNMLKSRLLSSVDDFSSLNGDAMKLLRERTLGNATNQLLEAGFIAKPTGLGKIMAAFHPGPLEDAMWAADNVNGNTLGKLHGTQAIPKLVKWGVGGLAAAGLGYFFMIKPQMDAAKKAAEEAAKQAEAQQQGGGAGGGQMTPELQAALQQFSQLAPAQQQQIIQQQYAALDQASRQPNLTQEQQQQLIAATQELELFMQVANGQAPGGAAAAGGGAAAGTGGAAPAAAGAGAATGGFTPQGLGLTQ